MKIKAGKERGRKREGMSERDTECVWEPWPNPVLISGNCIVSGSTWTLSHGLRTKMAPAAETLVKERMDVVLVVEMKEGGESEIERERERDVFSLDGEDKRRDVRRVSEGQKLKAGEHAGMLSHL